MEKADFLAEYRRRANEYARALARGDDPTKACASARKEAEKRFDRKTDPWGWMREMSRIIGRTVPL